MKLREARQFLPEMAQAIYIRRKRFLSLFLQKMQTGRDRGHQHVRGARRLINIQKMPERIIPDPAGDIVEKRGLSHGRQGLMQALHDEISPRRYRGFRKIRISHQMRAVGLVRKKRDPARVRGLHPSPDVLHAALVGRRSEDHRVRLRFPDLLRIRQAVPDKHKPEIPQLRRMIDGDMAPPLQKEHPSLRHGSRKGRKKRPGTAVYRKKGAFRAEE